MQYKHDNSLLQIDDKGKSYINNLMYRNIMTTLNYFTLAVVLGHFKIAARIAIELYKRTYKFNYVMYKSMTNDDLYQKTINPDIKVKG